MRHTVVFFALLSLATLASVHTSMTAAQGKTVIMEIPKVNGKACRFFGKIRELVVVAMPPTQKIVSSYLEKSEYQLIPKKACSNF